MSYFFKPIYLLLFSATLLIFSSCEQREKDIQADWQNKFADETIREIYTLKDQRNTSGLLPYLSRSNNTYRKEAALAFGSVQDSLSLTALSQLILNDTVTAVREAAAFAIGQTGNKMSLPSLKLALQTETVPLVQKTILKAFGKCANTPTDIAVIYDELSNSTCCKDAAVWGLYFAGLKNIFPGIEKENVLLGLLASENDMLLQLAVASYFARFPQRVKPNYTSAILSAAKNTSVVYVKNNLIKALANSNGNDLISFYETILNDSVADYRWKVSALKAASNQSYNRVAELYWKALEDKNKAVVITAAGYLNTKVPKTDIRRLIDAAKAQENIRAKADLLARCNELVSYKEVYDYISEVFNRLNNEYDVAHMIKTKGADGFAFEYIAELVKKDSAAVISTTTFGHFLQQLESEQFVNTLKADTNKKNNFIDTYKAFMLLGDAAITYAGANALNNQDLPLKSWISDYGFINNCLENLTIPRDIETWLALQNVIKATSDTTYQIPPMPKGNKEIDWAVLKDIKQGERFQMLTSKGPITLELFTEEAPGTVAMFTQLATQGFYNGKTIHRHVPDFVVQGGCPRGDGFGGLPETIRSEFSLREYDQEGLLGIASAGKDTESCQFFITHSPTPHLSGKYTIFARVTDGMEVVHQLEVGDTVEKVSK